MKRRLASLSLALLMCLSLLPVSVNAETSSQRGVLTYTQHIAPKYQDAAPFSEGLAAVKKDGKWGYIDTEGRTVIPFEYDRAYHFNEGLAVVAKEYYDKEYDYSYYHLGFINKDNDLTWFIDPYGYENGQPVDNKPLSYYFGDESYDFNGLMFYNGYISLNLDGPDYDLFGTDGKAMGISSYGWQVTENTAITGIMAAESGEQEFYNLDTGKNLSIQTPANVSGFNYYWYELRPFNQGVAPVAVTGYDKDWNYAYSWGVVNKAGNWVIQPAYLNFMVSGIQTSYTAFGQTGLAMVQNSAGKWGGIDKTGKTVIDFKYEQLWPYSFGLAAAKMNGLYGYLDGEGNVAIPAKYIMASGFSSNGYAVAYDGASAFLIDAQGNSIPGSSNLDPDTYFIWADGDDTPTTIIPDEYVVIEEGGKYGYGHIDYLPPLPQRSEMSSWSYELVTAAIEEDLVPVHLQNLYLNNITRADFCSLAVQAVEEVLEQDIEDVVLKKTGRSLDSWVSEYPFQDTTSSTVIAANALGIISGRGDGTFDPYSSITRQEAAVMLRSAAKALGMDTNQVSGVTFADSSAVAVWAKDAISFVYGVNVMTGTGENSFSPTGSYTREQSYITVYRLFQAVLGTAEA